MLRKDRKFEKKIVLTSIHRFILKSGRAPGSKPLAETETLSMVRIVSNLLFKQIIGISSLLFMLVTLYGCSHKSNSELLLGKWKLKSIIDLAKKTTRNFQSDQMIFLKITEDSIFQYENTFKDHPEKSGWKISNDTIHLTSRGYTFLDYKILELNDEELKVQSTIHLMSSHSKKTLIKSNKIELFERLN